MCTYTDVVYLLSGTRSEEDLKTNCVYNIRIIIINKGSGKNGMRRVG